MARKLDGKVVKTQKVFLVKDCYYKHSSGINQYGFGYFHIEFLVPALHLTIFPTSGVPSVCFLPHSGYLTIRLHYNWWCVTKHSINWLGLVYNTLIDLSPKGVVEPN